MRGSCSKKKHQDEASECGMILAGGKDDDVPTLEGGIGNQGAGGWAAGQPSGTQSHYVGHLATGEAAPRWGRVFSRLVHKRGPVPTFGGPQKMENLALVQLAGSNKMHHVSR
jgi:hypothetical protein